jgi:hypothetical protein
MKKHLFLLASLFLLHLQFAQGAPDSPSKKTFALFRILEHADRKFKEGNYKTAKQCLLRIQKYFILTDPRKETVIKTNPDGNSFSITIKDAIEGMNPHPTILQLVQAETVVQRENTIKNFLHPETS